MDGQRQLLRMILRTLSYFHVFKYPLTAYEVWFYLYREDVKESFVDYSFFQVLEVLDSESAKALVIETKEGFYFLARYSEHVNVRKERYTIGIRKYQMSLWTLRFVALCPYVEVVALCNSLPLQNTSIGGDIDMFIIAKSGRLWIARFWVVLFLKIFRLRPTPEDKMDRLCPSFFIADDFLNLEKYQIGNDIYLRFWCATVLPVYGRDLFIELWKKEQTWLKRYIPNFQPLDPVDDIRIFLYRFERLLKCLFEWLSVLIPVSLYKKIQLRALPKQLRDCANKDTCVVLTDNMLKFHDQDRRAEYRNRFEEIFSKYEKLL